MPSGWVQGAILIGALLGALLLFVAEFTALYQVHVAGSVGPIRTVGTGHNDSYALIPLALLTAVLGFGVFRFGSRPALLAIGIVGLVTLLIALLGDLPDAQATGIAGSASTHFVNASSTPSSGLYLETLGAVVLIATCVLGFLGLGRPHPAPPARGSAGRPPATKPRTTKPEAAEPRASSSRPAKPRTTKPSSPRTTKPRSPRTTKPSSPGTTKPSSSNPRAKRSRPPDARGSGTTRPEP